MDKNASPELQAGRILAHGKIADLSEGFSLPTALPSGFVTPHPNFFSIFLVPKAPTAVQVEIISCKLYHDAASSDCPFNINQWTEPSILELAPSETLLDDYDIYWGAAQSQ